MGDDSRTLELPKPGETTIEAELRRARNDIRKMWKRMDRWAETGFPDPRMARIHLHLDLERLGSRLVRTQRIAEKDCR